jgi:hypothetical protein
MTPERPICAVSVLSTMTRFFGRWLDVNLDFDDCSLPEFFDPYWPMHSA